MHRDRDRYRACAVALLALLTSPVSQPGAAAQELSFPAVVLPHDVDSGFLANPSPVPAVVFYDSIDAGVAHAVSLHFSEVNLPAGSLVRFRGAGGRTDSLDAQGFMEWGSSSDLFQGSYVAYELVAGPFTVGNRVHCEEMFAVDPPDFSAGAPTIADICGAEDNRKPSSAPAVGRLLIIDRTTGRAKLSLGTAFIVGCPGGADKLHLSAGHNFANLNNRKFEWRLEFSVPASNANCEFILAETEFRFPVLQPTVQLADDGIGKDWAVFRCGKHKDKTTFQKAAAALTLHEGRLPAGGHGRVTGYGFDATSVNDAPRGNRSCGKPCPVPADSITGNDGSRNFVQQSHDADYTAAGDLVTGRIEELTDNCGSSSGSPILDTDRDEVVGIQTHGACATNAGKNFGTRLDYFALQAALGDCRTVPDAVSDLSAEAAGDRALVRWRLAPGTVEATSAVRVQSAATADGPFVERSPLLQARSEMSWIDAGLAPESRPWYRLVLESRATGPVVIGPVQASRSQTPQPGTELYPPVESENGVWFRYSLASGSGNTRFEIFDAAGRRIQSLDAGVRQVGESALFWDRHSRDGARAPRGIYLIRMRAGAAHRKAKLILVRP